ncbi:hypothetical protein HAX54_036002 [Datura stramonium]|uniref:Uncharacterized protein n=1 Tax=Datura stramonium TaxID=4076 RepID=A0ABS8VHJ9_DATST|nr:hypothetical protein [Datura stramonium]
MVKLPYYYPTMVHEFLYNLHYYFGDVQEGSDQHNYTCGDPAILVRGEMKIYPTCIIGKDVETYATNKYELEKSKYESRYDLKLHKTILTEVFDVAQALRGRQVI